MSTLVATAVMTVVSITVLTATALWLVNSGIRAGDQAEDVRVTAVLTAVTQPDGPLPVVLATVRNPGTSPVLVGLSVRRDHVPGWLSSGTRVHVPRGAAARRLRAQNQDVLGVAGPREMARWTVPVPGDARRRYRLVTVAGQAAGRLRVISLPVEPARAEPPARLTPRGPSPATGADRPAGG